MALFRTVIDGKYYCYAQWVIGVRSNYLRNLQTALILGLQKFGSLFGPTLQIIVIQKCEAFTNT